MCGGGGVISLCRRYIIERKGIKDREMQEYNPTSVLRRLRIWVKIMQIIAISVHNWASI